MAWGYANGYLGQNLHIARNGSTLDLGRFFILTEGFSVTFEFWLLGRELLDSYMGDIMNRVNLPSYGNILMSADTGEITAQTYDPANPELKLSCIMAYVTVRDSGGIPYGNLIPITIYIHDSVASLRLNPNPITLRKSIDHVRFRVYASFDDGVVAEVSYYYGFLWSMSTGAPAFISINGTNGRISIAATDLPTTSQDYTDCVTLSQQGYFTGLAAITGTVKFIPDSFEAELISGNPNELETNMNILMIGDGILSSERDNFTKYVTEYANYFNNSAAGAPYNLFKDKTNFWTFFIESGEKGGALFDPYIDIGEYGGVQKVLSLEYIKRNFDGLIYSLKEKPYSALAAYQDALRKALPKFYDLVTWPTSGYSPDYCLNPGTVDLSFLINVFGLPSFEDTGLSPTLKLESWNKILKPDGTTIIFNGAGSLLTLDMFVYELWILLSKVVVINAVDSALGTYSSDDPVTLAFNETKLTDPVSFKEMISSLTYSGQNIGTTFFNADGTNAKDASNLIIYNRSPKGPLQGINIDLGTNRMCIVNLYDQPTMEKDAQIVDGQFFKAVVNNLESSAPFSTKFTTIHEHSHNYLKDEYFSGSENLSDTKYDGERPAVVAYTARFNVQVKKELEFGGVMDGTKIKWLWPRINKIGISSAALEPSGSNFRFKMTGTVLDAGFQSFDKVLLRKRDLFAMPGDAYPLFRIASINVVENYYILESLWPSPINVNDFPAGSIMINPVWNEGSTDYLKLVHNSVISRTTVLNTSLLEDNLYKQNEPEQPKIDTSVAGYNDPIANFKKPHLKEKIVGLYSGGLTTFAKGIYHPSGFCIMKGNSGIDLDALTFGDLITNLDSNMTSNYFCPVCRYIITDAINPLVHPEIDKLYENIYPTL